MSTSATHPDATGKTPPSAAMRLALAAAERVQGSTGSNPWVGAVLVREGAVVAEAATGPPGEAHAERALLQKADARGASLYVTLEPCAPFPGKRTPPCSEEIISAGPARVVIALPDPDSRVGGRGVRALREAGITVEVGDGYDEALKQLRPYVKHRQTGRPYVIAKYASSLDGRAATVAGESQWITGPEARQRVHLARARADAILVGSGTVMTDDPQLTARPGGEPARRQPLRVVLDGRGRTLPDAKLFSAPGDVLLVTSEFSGQGWREAIEEAGAELLVCDESPPNVPLDFVFETLGRRGILSVWAEGGGQLLGSLFAEGYVDELWAFVAPLIIGGDGRPAVGSAGVHMLTEVHRLEELAVERIADDVLIRGYVTPVDGPPLVS